MKILMREDIDVCGTSNEPIAILPEDQDSIYKALKEHGFVEDRAKEIAYEGQWSSFNGCETFYIEEIEDWS